MFNILQHQQCMQSVWHVMNEHLHHNRAFGCLSVCLSVCSLLSSQSTRMLCWGCCHKCKVLLSLHKYYIVRYISNMGYLETQSCKVQLDFSLSGSPVLLLQERAKLSMSTAKSVGHHPLMTPGSPLAAQRTPFGSPVNLCDSQVCPVCQHLLVETSCACLVVANWLPFFCWSAPGCLYWGRLSAGIVSVICGLHCCEDQQCFD